MKYTYYHDKLKDKSALVFLLLISILGFFLRLYHLGKPSLWLDELLTIHWIKIPLAQMLKSIPHSPFPPLYYILMEPWVNIFGYSEFSLRFPSLVFSTLSIIFIFQLSKEFFNEKVGLFSALLLSISPYSIYYAQEAKMYSMLWCLGILSFLFFHRYIKDNRIRSLLPYVIFTVASIYTLYVGFIFIIVQNILFFPLFKIKKAKRWLLGQLMIFLLYLPWIGRFLYHARHGTGIGWIGKVDNWFHLLGTIIARTTVGLVGGTGRLIELTIYCFLIISAILNLTNTKRKKYTISFTRNDYILFTWIIVPIVVYWLINTLAYPVLHERTTRYVGFIHIPLIILISKGINKYNIKFKSILLIFLLLATFLCRLYPLYQYNYRIFNYEDWRGLSSELHKRADNNSLILSKLPFYLLNYYNKGYEIKPLGYIKTIVEKDANKNFDSIFVIYKGSIDKKPLEKRLKGYKLEEDYSEELSSFLWFKKLQ